MGINSSIIKSVLKILKTKKTTLQWLVYYISFSIKNLKSIGTRANMTHNATTRCQKQSEINLSSWYNGARPTCIPLNAVSLFPFSFSLPSHLCHRITAGKWTRSCMTAMTGWDQRWPARSWPPRGGWAHLTPYETFFRSEFPMTLVSLHSLSVCLSVLS